MSSSVYSEPSPDFFDRPETEISAARCVEGPQRRRNRKGIPSEPLHDRMIFPVVFNSPPPLFHKHFALAYAWEAVPEIETVTARYHR